MQGIRAAASATAKSAKRSLGKLDLRALRKGDASGAVQAAKKATAMASHTVKSAHSAVHTKLFEKEAPTMYRFRGDKYSHYQGAQNRNPADSYSNLTPYITTSVVLVVLAYFIAFPLYFNANYEEAKKRYAAIEKRNQERLDAQFDRGQFSSAARRRTE